MIAENNGTQLSAVSYQLKTLLQSGLRSYVGA
jgi:hypothetical protein